MYDLLPKNRKNDDSIIVSQILVKTTKKKNVADGLEVPHDFLDILKPFHQVCHEDIAYKLKQNGRIVDLLNILSDFLNNRKERVALNDQAFSWTNVDDGVPQGSIVGFLITSKGLSSKAKVFVDTALFLEAYAITRPIKL